MDVYSWENHLFLWAIHTMAMLVITRGYNTSWLSECQELSRPAIGLDPTDLRFIQLSEAEENAGHHVVHQQNPGNQGKPRVSQHVSATKTWGNHCILNRKRNENSLELGLHYGAHLIFGQSHCSVGFPRLTDDPATQSPQTPGDVQDLSSIMIHYVYKNIHTYIFTDIYIYTNTYIYKYIYIYTYMCMLYSTNYHQLYSIIIM